MSNLRPYTKEWLEQLCKESFSFNQVLRKAGRKVAGGNQSNLKKKIQEFNIDISHFKGKAWNKGLTGISTGQLKYDLYKDILIKPCYLSRSLVRRYIHYYNVLEYKCQKCGCNGKWQDGQISLEIHHKDGDNTNNTLENLEYLCPNCHALTDSYRRGYKELFSLQ